jgi:hypothetical protein
MRKGAQVPGGGFAWWPVGSWRDRGLGGSDRLVGSWRGRRFGHAKAIRVQRRLALPEGTVRVKRR